MAGCATLDDGQLQKISFLTPGVAESECVLESPGREYRVDPPNTVSVRRENEDIAVTCRAPGYETAYLTLHPRVDPSTYQNFLNGLVPGLMVDHVTGGLYEYPSAVPVYMDPARDLAQDIKPANNGFYGPVEYFWRDDLGGSMALTPRRSGTGQLLQHKTRGSLLGGSGVQRRLLQESYMSGYETDKGSRDIQQYLLKNAEKGGEPSFMPNAPTYYPR